MELSQIGPFALEGKLGGPQSSVYRALHLQQKRHVALKVFPVPFAANDHLRTEFSDEMHLLKRLVPPQVAKCLGGRVEKHHAYLVQEIAEGETLANLVERRGHVAWEQAIEIAEGICQALLAAHALGLHHHDLLPDKIIMGSKGSVKVLDFRRDRANNRFCLSTQKRTVERLQFQAPEQIRREAAGPAADLYALGCLLFFMLSGRPPFVGTEDEIAEQQQQAVPPRVSSVVLDCPIWVEAIVTQLLQKEPNKRPYSAEAAMLALKEARQRSAAGGGVTQHALGGISSLKVGVDKSEARRLVARKGSSRQHAADDDTPFYERPWFGISLFALGLVVCIVVFTWFLWPLSPEKMIARADLMMASGDATQQLHAEQSYLLPLVRQYPGTDLARRAQEHLDVIVMQRAEGQWKKRQTLGQEPDSETGRLYAEALQLEAAGDVAGAQAKLQSMVNLIAPAGDDRAYVLLATRELKRLREAKPAVLEAGSLIEEKLAEATALQQGGNSADARKILIDIIALYSDRPDFAPLVAKVQARLDELSEPTETTPADE